MMEALAGLGLAANVAQFVEYAWRLLSSTHTIYRSSESHLPKNAALEAISEHAAELSNEIEIDSDSPPSVKKLAAECKIVAQDLLGALDKLKAKKGRSKWSCFVIALKDVRSSSETQSLFERLSNIQTQINAHTQYAILRQGGEISTALAQLDAKTKAFHMNVKVSFEGIQKELAKATRNIDKQEIYEPDLQKKIRREAAWAKENQKEISRRLDQFSILLEESDAHSCPDSELLDAIIALKDAIGDPTILAVCLNDLQIKSTTLAYDQLVLKSLHFQAIPLRHDRIKFAHDNTFMWMFDRSKYPFVDWLRWGTRPFFVQGKAGSGKSTMMKFLCNHHETMRHLQVWAGSDQLIVAKYFFWNSGTDLQKSQVGLLRSLLFDVFRQCPELVTATLPRQDHKVKHTPYIMDWSLENLAQLFYRLMGNLKSLKLCFFIDGLDEFDGQTSDLIALLNTISTNSNIKTCVSSRPWTEFLDAYGTDPLQLIKLEELTKSDVRLYVMDNFNDNAQFCRYQKDQRYLDIVETIVERARGVFLWVFLVVRSLLEGFVYADRLSDLQRRLDHFPQDLESYFQHMIDSVPHVYRAQTAQAFKVALESPQPLPSIVYSLLDEIEDDAYWALECDAIPMERAEIEQRHEEMKRRLDGRTKGLLEVTSTYSQSSESMLTNCAVIRSQTVEFLHRTVKDFIRGSIDVNNILMVQLTKGFDVNVQLCSAILAAIKLRPCVEHIKDPVGSSICVTALYLSQLMSYGREADAWAKMNAPSHKSDTPRVPQPDIYDILTEVDMTLKQWRVDEYEGTLVSAMAAGFVTYVEIRLIADSRLIYIPHHIQRQVSIEVGPNHPRRSSWPLLFAALFPPVSLNLDILDVLLRYRANPNQQYLGTTPWVSFLQSLPENNKRLGKPSDSEVVDAKRPPLKKATSRRIGDPKTIAAINMLVRYGANLQAKVGGTSLNAKELLQVSFTIESREPFKLCISGRERVSRH